MLESEFIEGGGERLELDVLKKKKNLNISHVMLFICYFTCNIYVVICSYIDFLVQ